MADYYPVVGFQNNPALSPRYYNGGELDKRPVAMVRPCPDQWTILPDWDISTSPNISPDYSYFYSFSGTTGYARIEATSAAPIAAQISGAFHMFPLSQGGTIEATLSAGYSQQGSTEWANADLQVLPLEADGSSNVLNLGWGTFDNDPAQVLNGSILAPYYRYFLYFDLRLRRIQDPLNWVQLDLTIT